MTDPTYGDLLALKESLEEDTNAALARVISIGKYLAKLGQLLSEHPGTVVFKGEPRPPEVHGTGVGEDPIPSHADVSAALQDWREKRRALAEVTQQAAAAKPKKR